MNEEISKNLRPLKIYINSKKEWSTDNLSDTYFNNQMEEIRNEEEVSNISISNVVNTIFEIHSTLKSRNQLKLRDAHSALYNSQFVNNIHIKDTDKISTNNQVHNIKNMLNCIICQELCKETVELDCCGQIYCNSCILQWVTEEYSCPTCRSEVLLEHIKPNRFIQRLILEFGKK